MTRRLIGRGVALVAVAAVGLAAGCRASGQEEAARAPPHAQSAEAFLASLGVNAHFGWRATAYGDLQKVEAAAGYIGVRNFRDGLDDSNFAAISQLAAAGFRFDIGAPPALDAFADQLARLERARPGAVLSVEGPNEVDGWPISYRGQSGYAGAAAFQKALWTELHARGLLHDVPVFNLTVSGVTRSKYQALGDLSPYADYANVHIYYGPGQPMYGSNAADPAFHWSNWLAAGQIDAPGRPTVVTETGSSTYAGGVDEAVQAKQILNSLMDAAHSGVAATYIYELADSAADPAGTNAEAHFGLYHADWTPKPAATALHNLTRILGGADVGAATPAASHPDYEIRGLPPESGQLLFQQRNGAFDIVVWAEPMIWDGLFRRGVTAPSHPVRIALRAPARAAVYDPLRGVAPIRSQASTREVAVELSDHPLIVQLTDPAPPRP